MKSRKYYVVWEGRKQGVFDSWAECNKQIEGYKGAKYKGFRSKEAAENALRGSFDSYIGKKQPEILLSKEELARFGVPIVPSISVDAACNMKTGKMEYQGVDTNSKKVLFHQGPFAAATNNVGEFLALVHGLAFLKDKGSQIPLYSDSRTAMSWVRRKKHKSDLKPTVQNKKVFELMNRAEKWLRENSYTTKILKWETKAWGEIPADFGRK